jgi:hypothetical protein
MREREREKERREGRKEGRKEGTKEERENMLEEGGLRVKLCQQQI